jgi:hypothetical protein
MFGPPYFARCLLAGGGALAVFGLILWRALPIASPFPPFVVTAVLLLAYGAYEMIHDRKKRRRDGP